jgi:hypothetical protein
MVYYTGKNSGRRTNQICICFSIGVQSDSGVQSGASTLYDVERWEKVEMLVTRYNDLLASMAVASGSVILVL